MFYSLEHAVWAWYRMDGAMQCIVLIHCVSYDFVWWTNARLSRTTPVANADADIPIDSTVSCSCFGWFGCSCFGWFGRKKRKVGLAQQELR